MASEERASARWPLDLFWVLFLIALALLPPIKEHHKQEILGLIGVFQLLESRLIAVLPRRGPTYAVLIKIGLATLLLGHSVPGGAENIIEVAINSSYYPIYYLPIMTAAMYFGPWGTLFWTLAATAAYFSFLPPVL